MHPRLRSILSKNRLRAAARLLAAVAICGCAAASPSAPRDAAIAEDGGPDDGLPPSDGGPFPDDDAGAQDGGDARDGGSSRDGGARDGGADAGCALPRRTTPTNPGWIGGACTRDADCNYDGGVCLRDDEGFPDGLCTLPCTSTCPDRTQPDDTVTFCIAGRGRLAGSGMCVARCDYDKEPIGCRPRYHCATLARQNDAAYIRSACVPGAPACYQDASDACVDYRGAANPLAHPSNCPNDLCDVVNAMTVRSPVNGIVWRNSAGDVAPMFMSCRLSLALHALGDILRDLNVEEARHLGTYNCREIAGTNCSLSMHGLGLAIDIGSFKLRDGTVISVVNDWEPQNSIPIEPLRTNPCRFDYAATTMKGQWLYELSYRMCDARIWSIILTPNYNSAHDNHFHVDLTAGYSRTFLGHPGPTVMRAGTSGE
jgi:hypothetical protein